jgi:hypothetical protein
MPQSPKLRILTAKLTTRIISVRGTLARGAPLSRLRVSATITGNGRTTALRARPRATTAGGWTARIRLVGRLRGSRRATVTLSFEGDDSYRSTTLRRTMRRS